WTLASSSTLTTPSPRHCPAPPSTRLLHRATPTARCTRTTTTTPTTCTTRSPTRPAARAKHSTLTFSTAPTSRSLTTGWPSPSIPSSTSSMAVARRMPWSTRMGWALVLALGWRWMDGGLICWMCCWGWERELEEACNEFIEIGIEDVEWDGMEGQGKGGVYGVVCYFLFLFIPLEIMVVFYFIFYSFCRGCFFFHLTASLY